MPLGNATNAILQEAPIGNAADPVAVPVEFVKAAVFGYAVATLSYQPKAVL